MSEGQAAGSLGAAERTRLEQRLGYRFGDGGLLEQALIHRSFANERGLDAHNERLEFLGDAVLGLVAAERLFRRHPDRPEGDLARAKSALVAAGALSGYAGRLELGGLLRLGVGEARSGGGRKSSLLADGLEALFGAVYLDGGPERAREVVERYLEWAEGEVEWERSDAKTELQERVQAGGDPLPVYSIVAEEGPEHDKRFVCEVAVRGEPLGRGAGRTKKEAQRQAAARALERARSEDSQPRPPADEER
ncbi:MAG TPA: ribonuclease III [Thermoanaerobaculia bacterium]|nr:ribonuclease III [Thermoanaerobaculia bacterium]